MTRFLGLDLGGTNIKSVVVEFGDDDEPAVVFTDTRRTEAETGPRGVTNRLIEAGRSTIEAAGHVDGLGIGVPGLFDPDSGEIELFPNLPGPWRGHSLRDPLGEALDVPATLINDARAFVLAEGTIGAGRGHRTVAGLTLGTGIGGGIMIEGRLQLGDFGRSGEIAHQIVVPNGPQCGCGNRGCIEALAKAGTLAAMVGAPNAETVYERARGGDPAARAAIEETAEYIGIGLANVIAVIGPSCIVIGGGIMEAGDLVLDPIRRAVESHVTLLPPNSVVVVPASLGTWAGGIGAALAAAGQAVRAR